MWREAKSKNVQNYSKIILLEEKTENGEFISIILFTPK